MNKLLKILSVTFNLLQKLINIMLGKDTCKSMCKYICDRSTYVVLVTIDTTSGSGTMVYVRYGEWIDALSPRYQWRLARRFTMASRNSYSSFDHHRVYASFVRPIAGLSPHNYRGPDNRQKHTKLATTDEACQISVLFNEIQVSKKMWPIMLWNWNQLPKQDEMT